MIYHFDGVKLDSLTPEERGAAVLLEVQNPIDGNARVRIPSSQLHRLVLGLLEASQDLARRRNDPIQMVTHAKTLTAALSPQMPEHCVVKVEIAEGAQPLAFSFPTAELLRLVEVVSQLPGQTNRGTNKLN
ncbi:hypothetical protein [Mesorhizobium sp. M0244]|uniref:hypothetical protein n=1 Tax=Mesorhizobium sp. M0244 TaxID=2956926 RepID=UPI0033364C7F